MAGITYTEAILNELLDLANEKVDGGSLEVLNSSSVVLVSIPLSNPAFEASDNGQANAIGGDDSTVISVGNPLIGTGLVDGVPSTYRVKNSGGTVQWAAPVAGNLVMTPPTVVTGNPVIITQWLSTMQ